MSFENKLSIILIALGFTALLAGCSKGKSDNNSSFLLLACLAGTITNDRYVSNFYEEIYFVKLSLGRSADSKNRFLNLRYHSDSFRP
ncbi:hypothetical protein [Leptospira inadai]|uniref:hypothetical protein n=1 Tax=Leptospira inadai TaxID=29506 RepID=UPI0011AFB9D1|nr:hypothetical protein [Leptospira inadai]